MSFLTFSMSGDLWSGADGSTNAASSAKYKFIVGLTAGQMTSRRGRYARLSLAASSGAVPASKMTGEERGMEIHEMAVDGLPGRG
jgi:hypothetical protein